MGYILVSKLSRVKNFFVLHRCSWVNESLYTRHNGEINSGTVLIDQCVLTKHYWCPLALHGI